jgi:hypothetical protein
MGKTGKKQSKENGNRYAKWRILKWQDINLKN